VNVTDADLKIIHQAMYERMAYGKPFTEAEQRVYDEIDEHLYPENWLEDDDGLAEDEYMERQRDA
jgi:hypothetical protein